MAFNVNDRVKVTSQHSEHRNRLGTVEAKASATAHGFNEVRLDGHPVGSVFNFADDELGTTGFTSPITY